MHPQNSLKYSNANLKVKIVEGVRVRSFAHSTSRVKGACYSFGMGIKMRDKRVNYSYGPTQTKQQIG
jgi:hypothetical protein